MPTYTPEQIYAAARALLPELDEARRRQVESLLEQAEHGEQTDLRILDLLSAEEGLRQQSRALLQAEASFRTLGDYAPLPGQPPSTPGQVYVCPVAGCDYRYVIAEAGEEPPPCPTHNIALKLP